ncbi:MAG: hypothetical protein K2X86_10780 [Cytophagaceae bacterium]|nr:hypothetical protein [Cytophagaceae bacterium]
MNKITLNAAMRLVSALFLLYVASHLQAQRIDSLTLKNKYFKSVKINYTYNYYRDFFRYKSSDYLYITPQSFTNLAGIVLPFL